MAPKVEPGGARRDVFALRPAPGSLYRYLLVATLASPIVLGVLIAGDVGFRVPHGGHFAEAFQIVLVVGTVLALVWRHARLRDREEKQRVDSERDRLRLELADKRGEELLGVLRSRNAELEAERSKWQAAIEAIADEVWMCDARGRTSLMNPAAVPRMGPEPIGDKSVEDVLAELDVLNPDGTPRKAEESPLLRSLRDEIVRGEEIMRHRGTGEMRYRQFSSAPIHDASGGIAGAVEIVRDITEGKRVQEALGESERMYRSLHENEFTGVAHCEMIFDKQGHPCDFVYIDVNRAFGELTGLYDVVGKRVTRVVPGIRDASPELFETYGRVVATGIPERFDIYLPPLRSWFAISVYCPKKDHFVAIFDNITARKAAEGERERLLEALRDADRRKNEFLAMLSHELRNPLEPIRNGLLLLERSADGSERGRRARAMMGRQVNHLARLVDDLLDVSRITRGKLHVERERIDLCEVVTRTVEDHRPMFAARRIELQVEQSQKQIGVLGDATRLSQVVGNVLQNAAKFTPEGGTVLVRLDQRGPTAILRVRDTGVGIDRDVMAHLFQPFTQADRSLDRSAGGLGLGLSLVKGLVELHGGEVEASSEGRNRGTEVTVRLPAEVALVRPTPPPPQMPRSPSRRVLVIEDNVDAAESLRDVLELDEHEVAVAFTGAEGLAKARTFAPDVVLCDIGLPGMDGYEVARAFRADGALHGVALVAVTGYASDDDRRKATDAGFDRHISKPPDLDALEHVLAELPDRHAA